jgi:hypothetical protein
VDTKYTSDTNGTTVRGFSTLNNCPQLEEARPMSHALTSD